MGTRAASRRHASNWLIVLLDSTVLIDHLRGRPAGERVEQLVEAGDIAATSAVNVEEIVRGIRPGEESAVDALFEGLTILPIGLEEGRRAGAWRREFAARGITLSQADCLIAAAALGSGARLATGNPADFPMADLIVEEWPVGR